MRCDQVDEQMAEPMRNIVLQPTWKKQVLSRLAAKSEYVPVTRERQQIQDRLRRLGRAIVDNLVSNKDYELEKRVLEAKLDSLKVPEVEAAFDAVSLIENLRTLWEKASAEERRKILLGMLDAVYLDLAQGKGIVGVSPKPVFRALFESVESREEAKLQLLKTTSPGSNGSADDGLLWWRRGRDGLHLLKTFSKLLAERNALGVEF